MEGTTWIALRALLVDRYDEIRNRLARQLGSDELARESLHESWLRLHRQGDAGAVQSPMAFVLSVAANVAKDDLRAERRRATHSQARPLLEPVDPAPSPEAVAASRLALERVQKALEELPPRTRAILVASRLEGLAHQQIADRLGISRRTVLYELKRAVEHLDARLEDFADGEAQPRPSVPKRGGL